ncbi:MAG: multiheme c-type cytochrome [Anaerolineales bacterium]
MPDAPVTAPLRPARLIILILVGVVIVLGFAVVGLVIGRSTTPTATEPADALATSTNKCVVCHRRTTPGIVEQFGHSTMAGAEVICQDCHQVDSDYPGASEHEGGYVLAQPTTAKCQRCHETEVAEYALSRHGLPAYVAYAGAEGLNETLLAEYESIPEGGFNPARLRERNALFALEGEAVTEFACKACHSIGNPAADGSVGDCSKCHLRHEFSLEQARKPETCNACHIGPDHPQFEIYVESPHGIAYHTGGESWHWEAEPGTLTVNDFPAPTCSICHMSGFGTSGTTHDVGSRLSWYLFAPVSERRPAWQDNQSRMQAICLECHNRSFIDGFYQAADAATLAINDWVEESDQIVAPLQDQGLLTEASFDEPLDFVYFELWHHWGRTAKFGAWMQGPDYTQWHGAYELLSDLAELRLMADERLGAAKGGD